MSKEATAHTPSNPNCLCAICSRHHPFKVPDHLLNAFFEGNCVLFAGGGTSTEDSAVLGYTFYDDIRAKLCLPHASNYSFPEMMDQYVNLPTGRLGLIKAIRSRISYIESMPELYQRATSFHHEISTLWTAKTIVTTNWDTFFEDQCYAQAFVFPEDIAFWDAADRRVLKIHGTIDNLGSIVATTIDYNSCAINLSNNMVGSQLKLILGTKTVVYCGYSLRDPDFRSIMDFVVQEMKGFYPRSYIVTLDSSPEALGRYQELNLTPIITDASFFIKTIKDSHVSAGMMITDLMYDEVERLLGKIERSHYKLYKQISMWKHPALIYCASYQDGLIHCLERILKLRRGGRYSHFCNIDRTVEGYSALRRMAVRKRSYEDVSYIDGYKCGLMFAGFFVSEIPPDPPTYYAIGEGGIETLSDLRQALIQAPTAHRAAFRRAEGIVSKIPRGSGVVFHHACRLHGLS